MMRVLNPDFTGTTLTMVFGIEKTFSIEIGFSSCWILRFRIEEKSSKTHDSSTSRGSRPRIQSRMMDEE